VSKTYILSEYIILTMPEDKKRINAFIPLDLYSQITHSGESLTDCITKALTLYFSSQGHKEVNQDILQEKNSDIEAFKKELEEFKKKEPENNNILQLQESKIKELQDQLKVKDDQIKVNEGHQNKRIEDLKNHIYLLDNQLRTKDDQIEKLNENMHKQAVHIQSLIQENSRLNTKLLPENTENKKSFWQSLKFW
jgi:predicted RNase H-like nuclease (RuvC/YqgF family)